MLHLIDQSEMIKITLRKKGFIGQPQWECRTISWLSCAVFSHHDVMCFRKEENILNLKSRCIALYKEFYLREELDKEVEQTKSKGF